MVAINSALAVDLTGQVAADTLGGKFFSGIGGQVDFIRGAARSNGGKPVIALPSTARAGQVSRIQGAFDAGAGVVTSRGDVHYVVTEYGVADLWGKSVRERSLALIDIAHPEHRAELLATAKLRHYVFPDQCEPKAFSRARSETLTLHVAKSCTFGRLRVTDRASFTRPVLPPLRRQHLRAIHGPQGVSFPARDIATDELQRRRERGAGCHQQPRRRRNVGDGALRRGAWNWVCRGSAGRSRRVAGTRAREARCSHA